MPERDKAVEIRALAILTAIVSAVKELKQVPSGHLYAALMSKMSLEQYEFAIEQLTQAKLISVKNHLITWIGD